ncbi:DUF3300 domain-containing protein [Sinorhizobium sp. BG8]|uniref:DUF3300 domain-containing protein n=1 Tax=Sinorhizobium sp. BG8 TaxID=2613773 RepID=UPI00193E6301|nr:DUF3300 domain-containing protein [Sinorhizobium sp. BG8]QRM54419.1 DUF3300 domain-containing protein [Sinorhizobium sp. BG8]
MSRTNGFRLATALWLILALSGSLYSTATAQEQTAAAATTQATDDEAPDPLSEDELEVLVARIALYPDELVALVTSASLYPLQVVEAARYLENLKKDKNLKPKDSWDGSIISLLNYPEVVKMMSDDLDWTQSLGDALSYQQKDVLVAIQQLRDKAVADGIIKTDDKMKVTEENENVVIQSANPETIYVPQYAPQMLYEDNYPPEPVSYYAEPYPNYYLPTATFFAGAITGGLWAAAVDWDDWGVWGGDWDGDIDVDCNKCFNNVDLDGKFKGKDIDWRNVDRSKINFDKNQFKNIDRNALKNNIKANDRNSFKSKANAIGSDRNKNIRNKASGVSVKDVRQSKIDKDRINRERANRPGGDRANRPSGEKIGSATAGNRAGQAARPGNKASNVKAKGNIDRKSGKPKPGARADNRPKKPSALGRVDSGKRTQMQSNRGRQAMGGGNRGGGRSMSSSRGHKTMYRGGGGGHRGGGGGHRGGGGRGGGRR